jgi:N-terminal domain of (some) glycogen debranching enzymes
MIEPAEVHPRPAPVEQPFLHDLVTCMKAPTIALSGTDGQIRAGGVQGVLCYDRRVLSELVVHVDGHEPVRVGHSLDEADDARFVGIVRHLGNPGADPTVRLERERRTRVDGVVEHLRLVNLARVPIAVTITVRAAVDLAGVIDVKHGVVVPALEPRQMPGRGLTWADAQTQVTLNASGDPTVTDDGFAWTVEIPGRSAWDATLTLEVASLAPMPNTFRPTADGLGWDVVSIDGPVDLARVIRRGLGDATALALADPQAPDDMFVAGGSPWFLTLFGRDSLWAAQFTLPLGTDLARGTLRTLARRQGTRIDHETSEAPGKILHEVRNNLAGSTLPPVYFGSVDATALWVCVLHDAWRWGMAAGDVEALLDPMEAALAWLLEYADSDGDGFLEYVDLSGRGLANQGWKDSGDSIQFPDGTLATAPISLSEVQGYAYEAANSGARLLEAFGRPGTGRLRAWATALQERFRGAFWVSDARGRFPAIALDSSKVPVTATASNQGHLPATGLLDPNEIGLVAERIRQPDMDSGYGLRTMSSEVEGFNPLGYHTGSVWPHDTAIAIRGLAGAGHADVAASLAAGLVRAAASFDDHLPELWGGSDWRAGDPVLAYPAACRPIAWSGAAAMALLQAAIGLEADVPGGVVRVRPRREFASWFPLRVAGLRIAGHPLAIRVASVDAVTVETTAPILVQGPA